MKEKDEDIYMLKTDSATCTPTGIRLVLSVAPIFKWHLVKFDFKSAFLKTGRTQLEIYVVPPHEYSDRPSYWLMPTAVYGLVNANAKWQEHSDKFLLSIG